MFRIVKRPISLVFSTCVSLHGVLSYPSISTTLTSFTCVGSLERSNSFSASSRASKCLLTRRFRPITALTISPSGTLPVFRGYSAVLISSLPESLPKTAMMTLASGYLSSRVLESMCSAVCSLPSFGCIMVIQVVLDKNLALRMRYCRCER